MSRLAESLGLEDHKGVPATPEPALDGSSPAVLNGRMLTLSSGTPELTTGKSDWLRGWTILQKHWKLSAAFAGEVMITVVLATALMKPIYAPVARVEIDPPGSELFSLEDRGRSDAGPDYLETQARNMQSDELLVSVMRQLQLDRAAEFTERGFVTRSIGAIASAVRTVPEWLWRKRSGEQPASSGDGLLVLSPTEASTLNAMQGQLKVTRDTASRLVTISFASHNPVLSATVTNTIVRSFIDRSYQTRHDAIMESTEWLSRQLDDIRAKMEESNRALANFQSVSGIADIDQYRSTFTDQLAELSRQKTLAQSDRIQIESFLNRGRSGYPDTLPQVQNNQVVQMLTQRLGEARAELAQALAVYGKNHPNAKRLQNQVEELESQIRLQRSAIVGEMQTSYAAALAREQLIDSQLRGTSRELGQMAQYAALKKEAQSNADLYNSLYGRIKEAGIAAASKSPNIRVVDQARVLNSPTRPQPLVNLGLGFCVALIGGIFLGLIREAFDHKVHTIQDVRQSIGISSVSTLPLAASDGHSMLSSFASLLGVGDQSGLHRPTNFLLDEPLSEQSEAFRGIHASIMLSQPGGPPRLLLVASSLPGEGKTTVAINLAVALARQGRTCIVDADLRCPSVHRAFSVDPPAGLSDYLEQRSPLASILVPASKAAELTIIGGGKSTKDPGKLVSSSEMRLLIRKLKEIFDFVIIDSPPILPYSDGRVLAPFVDGVVFVGRAGVTTREAMARSIELLQEVRSAPVVDVVLNGTSFRDTSYGYHYRYDRYSQA